MLETILNSKAKKVCDRALNGEKVDLDEALNVAHAEESTKKTAYTAFYETCFNKLAKNNNEEYVYNTVKQLETYTVSGNEQLKKKNISKLKISLENHKKLDKQKYDAFFQVSTSYDEFCRVYQFQKKVGLKLNDFNEFYNLESMHRNWVISHSEKECHLVKGLGYSYCDANKTMDESFIEFYKKHVKIKEGYIKALHIKARWINNFYIDCLVGFKNLSELVLDGSGNYYGLEIFWNNELNGNNFKKLKSLSLIALAPYGGNYNKKIEDISCLKDINTLEYLCLSKLDVKDISPLKSLTNLKTLNIRNTKVTEFSVLKELKSLEKLGLSDGNINSVSYLKELKNLKELYLVNTPINNITGLENLNNLELLDIRNTQVPTEQIIELIKKMSNLKEIIVNYQHKTKVEWLSRNTTCKIVFSEPKKSYPPPEEGDSSYSSSNEDGECPHPPEEGEYQPSD